MSAAARGRYCKRAAVAHQQSGGYEHRAKVVHIGKGGPRDHRVAQRLEEPMAVVALETGARIDALCARTLEAVGRQVGSGDVLGTIDAIGIAGDGMDAPMAVGRDTE